MSEKLQSTLTALFALLALCVILCHNAKAAAPAPISSIENQTAYATAADAATAALSSAVAQSPDIEQAGGIIKQGDSYYYTAPVAGSETQFNVRLKFAGQLVAIYHTHPGHDSSLASQFSPQDRDTVKSLKLPSYIRTVQNGEVYVLKPGGAVAQISGEAGLCHGMVCADYYKLREHLTLAAMGLVQR